MAIISFMRLLWSLMILMEEADKILRQYGYEYKRQKGSHRHYLHKNGELITIKIENPLKAVYVKDILNRINV